MADIKLDQLPEYTGSLDGDCLLLTTIKHSGNLGAAERDEYDAYSSYSTINDSLTNTGLGGLFIDLFLAKVKPSAFDRLQLQTDYFNALYPVGSVILITSATWNTNTSRPSICNYGTWSAVPELNYISASGTGSTSFSSENFPFVGGSIYGKFLKSSASNYVKDATVAKNTYPRKLYGSGGSQVDAAMKVRLWTDKSGSNNATIYNHTSVHPRANQVRAWRRVA